VVGVPDGEVVGESEGEVVDVPVVVAEDGTPVAPPGLVGAAVGEVLGADPREVGPVDAVDACPEPVPVAVGEADVVAVPATVGLDEPPGAGAWGESGAVAAT
jgi:hypothetical protein